MRNRIAFAALLPLLGLAVAASPRAALAQGLADYDYENLSFRGVGADVGYVWPNKVDPAWQYAVRFDFGFLGPAIRIVPTLAYWSSRLKTSELERLASKLNELPALQQQNALITAADLGDVDWSSLSLSLDAQAVWTAPGHIYTYIGAGFGLYSMNGQGDAIDGTFIEDLLDTAAAGLALMGGLEYEPSTQLRLFGEGRYTMQSDIRYPTLRFGAMIMFAPGTGARAP
jgi:opacity protein-like surface antigen